MFRAIHTIKGTCGFLGFTKLEGVSHVGESLLSCLRDGDTVLDAPITTALFGMVDAIREILASIERTGGGGRCRLHRRSPEPQGTQRSLQSCGERIAGG